MRLENICAHESLKKKMDPNIADLCILSDVRSLNHEIFCIDGTIFCMQYIHYINKSHAAFPFSCMQRKEQPTVDPKSKGAQGVCDPGAFKLGHLQSTKPFFACETSTLLTSHMDHFSCMQRRDSLQWTQKSKETDSCVTQGHSNWVICNLQNLLLPKRFPLYP